MVTKIFEQRCASLLESLGLGRSEDIVSIQPLTGGVASDIGLITLPDKQFCMKFALAKLRVAEDWQAPVHRNKAEYEWLKFAASCTPKNVPALLGFSQTKFGFAMEYLSGENVYLWKSALLQQLPEKGEAARVGDVIGKIHLASTLGNYNRQAFENRHDFKALRLEPYLGFVAGNWPEVQAQIGTMADSLFASDTVLVHGDVSPKNILFRDGEPVLLDAECATLGDASFDPAFCMNHLFLKALHLPKTRKSLFVSAMRFWRAYSKHIEWEDLENLERRVATLIPMLMLARVEGKSPVEYLSETEKEQVRTLSIALILDPPGTIDDLIADLKKGGNGFDA